MTTLALSPWTPLLALDRLNSWLRSGPYFCPVRDALKPVIYWTKTHAILAESKRRHIGLRRVMVKKKCRVCGGTGVYHSWHWMGGDDEPGEPCRACRATGIATLKFIETTIGPVRWHTPAEKWSSSSLDVYVPFPSYYGPSGDAHYEVSQDWQPQQKGRALTLAEVARDMRLVLHAWPHDVCFSLDFHHHAGTERRWRSPDIGRAEAWLEALFERRRAYE